MQKGEERLQLATLRMELRAIDNEIAAVRQESRRYRQMRFGLDIKDIQLTALQDQRGACAERVDEFSRRLDLPAKRVDPISWLLLPLGLWLHARNWLAAATAPVPVETPLPLHLQHVQPMLYTLPATYLTRSHRDERMAVAAGG